MLHDFVPALLQFRKSPFHPDLAFMEKDQPVSKDLCAGHVMGDNDGAHPAFFLQIYDQATDFLRGNWIQAGGRLIEEKDLGI